MVRKCGRLNFAQPSFIEGMARIFDVAGALNTRPVKYRGSTYRRDYTHAVRNHWEEVVRYLHDAIAQFEEEAQLNLGIATDTDASRYAPFPDPNVIRRYEEIMPGAANRILELAEQKQQEAFASGEAAITKPQLPSIPDARSSYAGMAVGFLSAALGLVGGACLIAFGYEWLGLAVAVTPLTALFGISIYAIRAKRRSEHNHIMQARSLNG